MLCIELELIQKTVMKLKRKSNTLEQITIGLGVLKKVLPLLAILFVVFNGYSQTVSIAVGDADVGENPIDNPGSFIVSRSNFGISDLTVSVLVTGTATPTVDYTPIVSTVVIPALQLQATINLMGVVDDAIIEGGETVIVSIQPSLDYLVGINNEASLTITDNDIAGVNVDTLTGTTTEAGGTTSFVFTLTSQPSANVTIPINNYDATEISGPNSVVITPASWNTGVTLEVAGLDDNEIDGDIEDVINTGNVSSPDSNYNVLNGPDVPQLRVTNIDDDAIVSVIATDADASEATPANETGLFTIDVGAINNTGSAIDVNYTISGTATNIDDFANLGTSVSIPNGQQFATVLVTPVDDSLLEGDELITLTVSPGVLYTVGTSNEATVTITDNDTAEITIGDASVTEGGILQFEITLDNEVLGGFDVTTSYTDISATGGGLPLVAPEDYNNTSQTINFSGSAGETQQLSITTFNDDNLEGIETFTVNVDASNINVTDTDSGTGTINDDDNCISEVPIIDASMPTTFCGDTTVNLNDFVTNNPPPGTNLVWSQSSNPLNVGAHIPGAQVDINVGSSGSYFGFFYDSGRSCSSLTIEIQLSANEIPSVLSTSGAEICGPGTVVLMATASTGASLNWYASADATVDLGLGGTSFEQNIAATTSFYVEAELNGCFSQRVEIVATVFPVVSAGTPSNGSVCSIEINGPVTMDLDDRLSGVVSEGSWTLTSDPSSGGVSIDANNVVDFTGLVDGDYQFTYTTTGAQVPCVNVSSMITIVVTDCETDEDGDGLFGGQEAILGTNPNEADTDGDGINDGDEVGDDIQNPLNEDNDEFIDALDSNINDEDGDGVFDQQDIANFDACIPNLTIDCNPNPVDLEILKIVEDINAEVGENVVFTITINNLSNSAILGAEVSEILESGFEYVSHLASNGEYNESTGMWDVGPLGALGQATLEITATVLEGGVYTNTASLFDSFPVDNTPENNSATVDLNVDIPEGIDLLIEKTAVSLNPLVGDEVVFTIKVTNVSVEDVVSQIMVSDLIGEADSSGFEYRSHTVIGGNDDSYDVNTGIWSIPQLEKDEFAVIEITVTVPNEGTFTNTANILSSSPADSNPENNSASVDVIVSLPTEADPGFVFNQFSPNGDGTNDFLKIRDIRTFSNTSVQIFDRYGNIVFEAANMQEDAVWDGTREGEESPAGTYFYVLDLGDGTEVRKGWIQLFR